MIQRKQTLFLLQVIFLGVALLFISSQTVLTNTGHFNIQLIPIKSEIHQSSIGHIAAIALNLIGLILAFIIIFIYKKRELQIRLSYILIFILLTLALMIAFCPFAVTNENILSIEKNYFASIVCFISILATWFAIKFIKKDIELLKSADRIR